MVMVYSYQLPPIFSLAPPSEYGLKKSDIKNEGLNGFTIKRIIVKNIHRFENTLIGGMSL